MQKIDGSARSCAPTYWRIAPMWFPRCLRPVGWMPEKMTIRTGEDIPPVRRGVGEWFWSDVAAADLGATSRRGPLASRPVPRLLALAVGAALLSLPLVAPAPDYDPWAWLLWGRELAGGGLSTVDGPAFKPLPVAVCAALSAFGGAAPWLWVVLARAGAVLAVWLAWRLAGWLAAAAVLLCAGFLEGGARGLR